MGKFIYPEGNCRERRRHTQKGKETWKQCSVKEILYYPEETTITGEILWTGNRRKYAGDDKYSDCEIL